MRRLIISLLLTCTLCSVSVFAAEPEVEKEAPKFGERIAESPFVALYVLEELKQLRIEMALTKNELIQQVVDREVNSIDRGVEYATNTISYFFYLIAAVSSVLVLVGWTSIRDIKDRVHTVADEEIAKLIETYEVRLHDIERQLHQKTELIEDTREEVALNQQLQSLWLRAGQESSPNNKIVIYDQILSLRPVYAEALTYKADAVLDLDEPQWAMNLCHQALNIEPDNSHAFYQLACAHAAMGQLEESVNCLVEALERSEAYRDDLSNDPALAKLIDYKPFQQLIRTVD